MNNYLYIIWKLKEMNEVIQKVSPVNKALIFGRLSKVGSGVHLIYTKFFKDEREANKLYKAVLPSLNRTITNQGYEAEESKALIELLIQSAPYGAKRRNFEKKYFGNSTDWKKLPENPDDIPYGFWF